MKTIKNKYLSFWRDFDPYLIRWGVSLVLFFTGLTL